MSDFESIPAKKNLKIFDLLRDLDAVLDSSLETHGEAKTILDGKIFLTESFFKYFQCGGFDVTFN